MNRKQLNLFFQVSFSFQAGLMLEEDFGAINKGVVVLLMPTLSPEVSWKYLYHLLVGTNSLYDLLFK